MPLTEFAERPHSPVPSRPATPPSPVQHRYLEGLRDHALASPLTPLHPQFQLQFQFQTFPPSAPPSPVDEAAQSTTAETATTVETAATDESATTAATSTDPSCPLHGGECDGQTTLYTWRTERLGSAKAFVESTPFVDNGGRVMVDWFAILREYKPDPKKTMSTSEGEKVQQSVTG